MASLVEHFNDIDFRNTKTESSTISIIVQPTNRELSIQVRLHRNSETLVESVSIMCPEPLSALEQDWFYHQVPELVAERRRITEQVSFPTYKFLDDVFVYAVGNYTEDIQNVGPHNIIKRGPHYCQLMTDLMDVIDQFMVEYERDFQIHTQITEHAKTVTEETLQEAKIFAWVSARAKKPDRLRDKILQRAFPFERGKRYRTTGDIYADLVDLAGVRVSLYFPGDRDKASQVLSGVFQLASAPKIFPADAAARRRFSGYRATHLRVAIHGERIQVPDRTFFAEVQIASVIMHAWAEVEHDLQYKRQDGQLSPLELEMLDQLNGLALAGEISLEQLQVARTARMAKAPLEKNL